MTPNPLALIAEITHRCPLHCVYCSNPLEMAAVSSELSTPEWIDVFQQAGRLGMLHAHFTGGEPLARPDLTELIASARAAGLYTNLITSGLGLAETRLQALVDAGLDHVQLSFQDSRENSARKWRARMGISSLCSRRGHRGYRRHALVQRRAKWSADAGRAPHVIHPALWLPIG